MQSLIDASKNEITTRLSVIMGGYGLRTEKSDGVHAHSQRMLF